MTEENKSLEGTQTEKNLKDAFTAEATSLLRYVLYSKKSEFQYFRQNFMEIAKNEKEHAEKFLEFLGGIGDDEQNLKNSVALEGFTSMIDYPHSAKVAEEEGFYEIAKVFQEIAIIEARHKKIFEDMLNRTINKTVLFNNYSTKWVCMKCGYIFEGVEPPNECPVCGHDWKHFELYKEDRV